MGHRSSDSPAWALVEQCWDDFDVLSLDVYDTALLRSVFEPRDVFVLVEHQLLLEHGRCFDGFATARFEAELALVRAVWRQDRSREVTLDGIYDALVRRHPAWAHHRQRLQAAELDAELTVTTPNPAARAVYDDALRRGKRLVFATDIYLPAQHIERVLERSGYGGPHRLFVSCEVGLNKASGRLFDHMLSELATSPQRILHIGDNLQSDFVQARQRGLRALRCANAEQLWRERVAGHESATRAVTAPLHAGVPPARSAGDVAYLALAKRFELQRHDLGLLAGKRTGKTAGDCAAGALEVAAQVGYLVLGPILAGFSKWLIEHAAERGHRTLHFVSRDGWLLQQAFRIVAARDRRPCQDRYFLSSRRALLPAVFDRDVRTCLDRHFLFAGETASLRQYLSFLGLSKPDAETAAAHGLGNLDERIDSLDESAYARRRREVFLTYLEFRVDELARGLDAERETFLSYMRQEGLFDQASIAFVDCGWHGSGLAQLSTLIRTHSAAPVTAYYLGAARGCNAKQSGLASAIAYLHHEGEGIERTRTFTELARLLELFLSTDQPPLLGFERRSQTGQIVPRFDLAGSAVDPRIRMLQSQALRYVEDYAAWPTETLPRLPHSKVVAALHRLVESPTRDESRDIGTIPYCALSFESADVRPFAVVNLPLRAALLQSGRRRQEIGLTGCVAMALHNARQPWLRALIRTTPLDEVPPTRVHRLVGRIKRAARRLQYAGRVASAP
jgi:FMN phosphatase YigB (HAD superfamily)